MTDIVHAVMRLVHGLLPPNNCDHRQPGIEGRRQEDSYLHAKFWYWGLFPITLPMTGMVFVLWIAMVCAVYGVLLPLMIVSIPFVWGWTFFKMITERPSPSARYDVTGP